MAGQSYESGLDPQQSVLGPSEAEIEAWAAREQQRREEWLKGPTAEQRAAWARQERERRLAELGDATGRRPGADQARMVQRSLRQAQLAAEGAMSLLFKLAPAHAFAQLVRAGQEWEEEFTSAPAHPRRVLPEADAGEGPGGQPAGPSRPT